MFVRPHAETIKGSRSFEKYPVIHFHKQQESFFKSVGKAFQSLPYFAQTQVPPSVSPLEALRRTAPLSSLREIELRKMTLLNYNASRCKLFDKLFLAGVPRDGLNFFSRSSPKP